MEIVGNSVMKAFLARSLSGTCSTVLFQPLDLVKTRLQTNIQLGSATVGMTGAFRQIVHTDHVVGLWKVLSPSLVRTMLGV